MFYCRFTTSHQSLDLGLVGPRVLSSCGFLDLLVEQACNFRPKRWIMCEQGYSSWEGCDLWPLGRRSGLRVFMWFTGVILGWGLVPVVCLRGSSWSWFGRHLCPGSNRVDLPSGTRRSTPLLPLKPKVKGHAGAHRSAPALTLISFLLWINSSEWN